MPNTKCHKHTAATQQPRGVPTGAPRDRRGSEKLAEATLRRRVLAMGGLCLKYASHTDDGYPDRLCILPGGRHVWVELKSIGQKPRPLQQQRHARLKAVGAEVHVLDCVQAVEALCDSLASALKGEGCHEV